VKKTPLLVLAALIALAAVPAWSTAGGTHAKTTVTIKVEGRDFSGTVRSPRPRRCADGRKIFLMKQVGSEQHPATDPVIASDTASKNGDVYQWSTGNTGQSGRFYARAKRNARCKGDTSRTLHTEAG
jgi:hypothetical protein